jgi:hypothetical protein
VSVLLAEVPRSVVASPALLDRFPTVNTPEDLQLVAQKISRPIVEHPFNRKLRITL